MKMKLAALEERLVHAAEELTIVDAHEHLPPEDRRTSTPVDVFTLFSHYTQTDLKAAGMTPDNYRRTQDPAVPLPERWDLFAPFWDFIRFGSYARASLIALEKFYGFTDVTEKNYRDISAAMQAANTPGIYDRVLRQTAQIRVILNQSGYTDQGPLFRPILAIPSRAGRDLAGQREILASLTGTPPNTLEEHLAAVDQLIQKYVSQGIVGLKMAGEPLSDPSLAEATLAYSQAARSAFKPADPAVARCVNDFITHHVIDLAGRLNLVVAVHTGLLWDNWRDFSLTHPRNMIPVLARHRDTRFDLYHAGIPWTGDLGVMLKNFPNAFANLCWCHVISPEMTVRALDEWLDLAPVNKILGFGGDYARPVEKVYGHLVMCRQDLARVLARRIDRELLSFDDARWLLLRFLVENPAQLYRLPA